MKNVVFLFGFYTHCAVGFYNLAFQHHYLYFLELKKLRMSDKDNTFVPKFKSNLKFVQLQYKNLYIN